MRGHVFSSPDNSTLIIAIKGTALALIGGGGGTAPKDKLNVSIPALGKSTKAQLDSSKLF